MQIQEDAKTTFPSFFKFDKFDVGEFLGSWSRFYKEVYDFEPAIPALLPPIDQALGAGVVMAGDFGIENDLYEIKKRTENGRLYRYTDSNLDDLVQRGKQASRPNRPYAVWAYPAVEATDQASHLAEKSYDDIKEMSVPVMNYGEYTRFFLWYLWATGKPLDIKSVTLSGSLVADGGVLSGYWRDDGFLTDWCVPTTPAASSVLVR